MNILFPYMARWKSINWTRYHNLFTEFAKRGHNICIIQPPSLKSEETNFLEINIEIPRNINLITIENIPFWNLNIPFPKILKKGLYSYILSKKIDGYIKKFDIDVVFIYNIPQYLLIKKIKRKAKIIFDISDDYPEMLIHEIKFFKNLIRNFGKLFLNKIIKMSDLVITSANGLKEKYYRNAYLIPNGVDLNLLKNYKVEKKDRIIIGFIGSFEYFIDFDLIFYLAKNLKNIEFYLVGRGRLFKYVKNYLEKENLKNIILTGQISHDRISEYLNKFDLALLPLKRGEVSDNTCPLKLFEYALFKISVIGSNTKELKLIGEKFINFYQSKEDALNLIKEFLENKNKFIKKCEYGYELVNKKYNWQSLADEYLRIIEKELKIN
ncbi:MAG: glycosyltransferase [Caldisericia bacterium]